MKESNKQRSKRITSTTIVPSTIITPTDMPECKPTTSEQWFNNMAVFGVIFALSTLALVFL